MDRPIALTIAGSDPSGGAGVQGDLKTFQALGVYGLSVITAITAQDTTGVVSTYTLPAKFVTLQIKTVADDINIHAVKIGMVSSQPIIASIAHELNRLKLRNLVIDPVLQSKSGTPLLVAEARESLLKEIIPLARIVTPNIPEAEQLCGLTIESIDDMKEAAHSIFRTGVENVLVKGGHLDQYHRAVDILYDGHNFHEFSHDRIDIPDGVHGTGCAFSSAIAAGLAKGLALVDAISIAKRYVTEAIMHRFRVGRGTPVLEHSWNMVRRD